MINKYRDRKHAGQVLAAKLKSYANQSDIIVLALPRGGVPVAYEVAKALEAPLDVFVVRKLGVPGHKELAMGAIASGGVHVFNHQVVKELNITIDEVSKVLALEEKELRRREKAYRGNKPFPTLKDTNVILVDDGIATGASVRAAVKALREHEPAAIIGAVPVADKSIIEEMEALFDVFICPMQPVDLFAVGAWYEDFSQTEDEEVYDLLKLR